MFITLGGAMRKPRGWGGPEPSGYETWQGGPAGGGGGGPLRVWVRGSVFALGLGVAWGAVEVLEFFEVHPADAGGFDG